MLEVEKEGNWWQDEKILAILEERSTDYKSGKVKAISWETAKQEILVTKNSHSDTFLPVSVK